MKEVWFSKQGDVEQRVVVDECGFYYKQIRFLPLEEWEMADGWRTTYISPNGLKAVINH